MKRGVELSMNVIIIAAIALIVLVVLVLLVTNASQTVREGTGCQAKSAGDCYYLADGETCGAYLGEPGYVSISSDCPEDETCCFKPLGGGDE